MNHDNRLQLQPRADRVIAQGALTNSKRPTTFVKGVYPTHIKKAKGCYVWDETGKRYTDFICALGTNLLGYAHPEIEKAIADQLPKGVLYSLGSEPEVLLGEKLTAMFPYMEKFKFLKTGSEGCSAAVRMARASTKKILVVSDGYHGWHDEFVSLTEPAWGVADVSWPMLKMTDMLSDCEGTNENLAAVMIEPVLLDASEARIKELRRVRERCDKFHALLIFDETITALRFPGLTVAKWSGVIPDITVMGKALAGGLPLSVVAGKKAVMDSDYFVSGTYCGETLSLVAALKTLSLIEDRTFFDQMWFEAAAFQKEFNRIDPDIVQIEGWPLRGVITGTDLNKALFFQETCKAGMLFGPSFFWCEPHRHERRQIIPLCRTIFNRIRLGEVTLEGEMPVKPFSQQQRDLK